MESKNFEEIIDFIFFQGMAFTLSAFLQDTGENKIKIQKKIGKSAEHYEVIQANPSKVLIWSSVREKEPDDILVIELTQNQTQEGRKQHTDYADMGFLALK